MSEEKKTKRAPAKRASQRPRIDAICRHILAGSYDDEIPMLLGAIESRQNKRKEAVEKLVKEVYGQEFVVTQPGANPPAKTGNPFVDKALKEQTAHEVLPGQSPHVLDPNSPEAKQALADEEDRLAEDPDYESRSPMIGSIEP